MVVKASCLLTVRDNLSSPYHLILIVTLSSYSYHHLIIRAICEGGVVDIGPRGDEVDEVKPDQGLILCNGLAAGKQAF